MEGINGDKEKERKRPSNEFDEKFKNEEQGTVLYEGVYVDMYIPQGFATMWKMVIEKDDGKQEEIWGDWRPMMDIYENINKGTRVVVISHPDYFLPLIKPLT